MTRLAQIMLVLAILTCGQAFAQQDPSGPRQKAVLSQAAMDTLAGAWHGPVSVPGAAMTFVARFKRNDKGELTGTLSAPEQGGQELPMDDIQFTNNKLDFKILQVQGEFIGDYANGGFTGVWRQPGTPPEGLKVSLTKGDVATPVFALKLSAESFASLTGKWSGKLTGPQGSITVVMRFEVNSGGQYVGFLDSPDQGATGLPIAEVSLAAGKLTARMTTSPPAQFEATLSGNTMVGQLTQNVGQGPMSTPLTLTRQ
jgi:hypothetical protein